MIETSLRKEVTKLEGQLAMSNKCYEQLLTKLDTLRMDPQKPSLPLSGPSPTTNDSASLFMCLLQDARAHDTTPSPKQSEFPLIVYWNKKEYLKGYNNGKGYLRTIRNDDSGMVGFLEDENGNIVNKDEQARMREFQRSLAYTLLKFGLAPTSWGRCTQPAQEYVVRSMRLKFPIFCYCADNWKADTFMGLYYSQWADCPQISNDSEGHHVKQETTDSTIEPTSNGKTTKRPSSPPMTNATKQKKLKQDNPDALIPTAPKQLEIIRALPGPPVSQLAAHTVSTTTATPNISSLTRSSQARSFNYHSPLYNRCHRQGSRSRLGNRKPSSKSLRPS
ncbi:hypothetical protein JVT61DRAFT_818 [Boletus reticuloceps]|uniref:Uncharacterized protein n=1 Tax=Boletus reticuloceps TaxID=495285 RepID=A0A8I2Z1Q6_9AGAM|nr:hypothetical protein JVT61DRAFT_818 [Boletus reticuloceps]